MMLKFDYLLIYKKSMFFGQNIMKIKRKVTKNKLVLVFFKQLQNIKNRNPHRSAQTD